MLHSPTLMTMGGFAAKSVGVVVLLLVTRLLPEADIQLWLSFSLLISLQMLADFGFTPSVARAIAYAYGGATRIEGSLSGSFTDNLGQPNWVLIGKIFATLRRIYARLALFAFLGLLTVGTWLVHRPIAQLENPAEGWGAWGVILFVSLFYLRGNLFFAFLEGVGKVALLRRWEMLFHLLRAASSLAVLWAGWGLFWLIAANQFWLLMNVLRNRLLSYRVYEGQLQRVQGQPFERHIYQIILSRSQKSAVGQFFSVGVVYLSALFLNLSARSDVASYQLALMILQMIGEFSRAPFYSQIPFYNMLVARQEYATLVGKVRRSMALSLWLFTLGAVGTGLFLPPVLHFLESNTPFVSPLLWGLLALGMFGERYGALHLQLYTTTNHVVWHIVNTVAGLLFLGTLAIGYALGGGLYAFAGAFLVSNFGFYTWYSAWYVYRTFPLRVWAFERRVSLLPFVGLLAYLVYALAQVQG